MPSLNRILDPLRHCCQNSQGGIKFLSSWLNSNYRQDYKRFSPTESWWKIKQIFPLLSSKNYDIENKLERIRLQIETLRVPSRGETSLQRRFEDPLQPTNSNSQKVRRNWRIIFTSSCLPKFHATRFAAHKRDHLHKRISRVKYTYCQAYINNYRNALTADNAFSKASASHSCVQLSGCTPTSAAMVVGSCAR